MKKPETIETARKGENAFYNYNQLRETTPDKISNEVLSRLIEEVRNDEKLLTNHAYNRFHNRHNR